MGFTLGIVSHFSLRLLALYSFCQRFSNEILASSLALCMTEDVVVNGTVQVVVNGLEWNHESAILNRECLWALGWPVQMCV